ncbi:conserved protein of unknown function [Streptantibioticus cattleyicolor NRRL 8057 = DSM 46488]|nr:conserved protein of unknown function [Streptantibioticus cattleyicolor NRRL 8057 = DSM 46488]
MHRDDRAPLYGVAGRAHASRGPAGAAEHAPGRE